MKKYDIIVIGAGSGGLVSALEANRRGAKVAMLEKHKIGGECTHSGCVPSKALLNVAKQYKSALGNKKFGLPTIDGDAPVDFAAVMEHVDGIVQGVYAHETPDIFINAGIDTIVHPSGAVFVDENTVEIGGERLSADNFIISTGSAPRLLPTEGDVEFLNNENFWDLRELPDAIAFVGGGVISVELGQSLARLGSNVTILERGPRILGVVDEDIAAYAIEQLEAEGITILNNANVDVCSVNEDGKPCLHVTQEGVEAMIDVDKLFVAIGRIPNMNGLGLDEAGVGYSRHGITVNELMQTSVPHIYAVGDVASRAKFTHVAAIQAERVVKNIIYGGERQNDLSILPWAIFTDPEIGHVGLTEAQAREQFEGVQTNTVNASIDRFITDSKVGGMLKVVMDADDKILGGTAVGAHAGEWIQLLTVAMHGNMTAQDIAGMIFAYPTYSEIVKKAFTRFLRTKL